MGCLFFSSSFSSCFAGQRFGISFFEAGHFDFERLDFLGNLFRGFGLGRTATTRIVQEKLIGIIGGEASRRIPMWNLEQIAICGCALGIALINMLLPSANVFPVDEVLPRL